MQFETIHFILTGGTIDSYWDGIADTAVPLEHSVVPEFIRSLKLYNATEFTEVCMKDSRKLNEDDRQNILSTVEQSNFTKIIITHGTYTAPDTARFLKVNLKRTDQTIILTSSMVPIRGFSPSDGPFNLGYAVAQIQSLKPGIYVCMNGRVFSPEEVVKAIQEGRFISVFNK
jgi:L-asparaginase